MKLIGNSKRDLMVAGLGAFLCALLSASSPAVAQVDSSSSEEIEQVIVRSPYIVRREPLPRTGAPSAYRNPELLSVSRAVSYADLNLSTRSGVAELESRSRTTARQVCDELNARYPKTGSQYVYANTDCVKQASDDAMVAIRQISAVASR